MAYIDKIQLGNTTYDIQDTSLKNTFSAFYKDDEIFTTELTYTASTALPNTVVYNGVIPAGVKYKVEVTTTGGVSRIDIKLGSFQTYNTPSSNKVTRNETASAEINTIQVSIPADKVSANGSMTVSVAVASPFDKKINKIVDTMVWEQGGMASNGTTQRNDRIHTTNYVDETVSNVTVSTGYLFTICAYQFDKYVGYLNNQGTIGGDSVWLTEYDIAALAATYPFYRFKIGMAMSDKTSNIAPSAGSNCTFTKDLFKTIRNEMPNFVIPEEFNLNTTEIWKSSFGTVAVPQGLCFANGYLYVCGQQQGGSDSAPSFIYKFDYNEVEGKVTVSASNTTDNFGHCSGIAIDTLRDVGYIAKWDAETNYSTLYKISTSTLTETDTIDMTSVLENAVENYQGFTSCAYNDKYDKLILAMRGVPHCFAVLNASDLSLDYVFKYPEPATEWTLQGIMSIDDVVYLTWCVMESNVLHNYLSGFDWNGKRIFKTEVGLTDELEAVAFNGSECFFFTYNDTTTSGKYAPVYNCSFKAKHLYKADVSESYPLM